MTHHCLKTILLVLPRRVFWRFICIKFHLWNVSSIHSVFLYSSRNNQLPCGSSFHIFVILHWSVFFYSCFFVFHKSAGLRLYFPQFLYVTLKNFVLVLFLNTELNVNTLSYIPFYGFCFPKSSVFQNQRVYFLNYL